MLNNVVLIGRLTKDCDLRYTPNGVAVTRFTLAVDRPFKNQQGEKETDFIPIVVWRKMAEVCAQYIGKGRLVAVEGRIAVRTYDDNGNRRWVTEVIAENVRFLDYGKKDQEQNQSDGFGSEVSFDDSDIPF